MVHFENVGARYSSAMYLVTARAGFERIVIAVSADVLILDPREEGPYYQH